MTNPTSTSTRCGIKPITPLLYIQFLPFPISRTYEMENFYWAEETALQLHPWLPPGHDPPHYDSYHPDVSSEDRTASASRSHSEAEKRRRDRINAQLATLRKLIPKSEKQMDKAALLGHVVDHVKEQSQRAKEATEASTIPTEIDEVMIDYLNAEEELTSNNQSIYMKASICCDDRPEFFAELKSALKGLGATIAEAELTSLGGRIKANFILCCKEQNSLNQSLRMALSRLVITSGSTYSARSKRQRFFYPTSDLNCSN